MLGRFAWVSLLVVGIGFTALGLFSVDSTLRVTAATRRLVTISDGWKRVRFWIIEEETRERKYVIERAHVDRPYHRVAVDSVAKSARDLEPFSTPADVKTIERLLADNAAYGAAMRQMFDAVDAHDVRRIAAIHRAVDPAYDRMEHAAHDAEARYGHAAYLALASLERTEFNIARAFPILAVLGLLALGTSILVIREYRRRSDAIVRLQVEALEAAALDDALTRLGNHRAFRAALAVGKRPGDDPALVHLALVDIDHFKKVNDRYGHIYGDNILHSVGELLREAARHATAYRIGGDEFALVFRGVGGAESFAELEGLRARAPEHLNGQTLSIGVATFDVREPDLAAIHERADVALYEAKHRGRNNVVRFESALVASSSSLYVRRLALERVLAQTSPYRVVFQPIWRLDGRIDGYEALTRFGHEFASPLDAFDVAERLDRTPELDRRCIDSVAAQLPKRFAQRLFLNVSATTLAHESVAIACFERFARITGLAPHRITIELSEQTRVSPSAITCIANLRSRGFRIALDDTGSGNAGMAILSTVPLDAIKVDGPLLAAAETDKRAYAVVSGILVVADHLGYQVVIEGIETAAHIARCYAFASRHDMADRFALQGYALGLPGAMLPDESVRHPLLAPFSERNASVAI